MEVFQCTTDINSSIEYIYTRNGYKHIDTVDGIDRFKRYKIKIPLTFEPLEAIQETDESEDDSCENIISNKIQSN